MQIRQFVDEGLGNSAHLIISERAGLAALADPLRDVDRYLDAVDVRPVARYLEGHIAGARHVEAGALATGDHGLPRTVPIATHCGHEQRSATALSLLERPGYADLHLIEGGWSAWRAAGYPVADGVGAS